MKIIAPNKNYTGISAGVAFAKGVAECENPRIIEWFKNHGYTITDALPVDDNDTALKTELVALRAERDATLTENTALKTENNKLKTELAEVKKSSKK